MKFAHGCWIEEVREAMLPVGSMMLSFRTTAELARLQRAVKEEIVMFHQRTGVKVLDIDNTYIDPRVTIGAGTLYALLSRFEAEGLISLTRTLEGRKYYQLTAEGEQTLQGEYDRLRRQVQDGATLLDRKEETS